MLLVRLLVGRPCEREASALQGMIRGNESSSYYLLGSEFTSLRSLLAKDPNRKDDENGSFALRESPMFPP